MQGAMSSVENNLVAMITLWGNKQVSLVSMVTLWAMNKSVYSPLSTGMEERIFNY